MKKLFLSVLLIGGLFTACSSDSDNNQEPPIDKNYHTKEFIKESKDAMKQEFALNTSQLPKTLVLKEKTKVTIPSNVFTKDGNPITGNFTVEIYEMLKPSSIVLSGTNTNHAYAGVLLSDGFLHIDAKQNGVSLDKNLTGYIRIAIPTDKEDGTPTELWTGMEDAGVTENQFAWNNPEREDFDNANMEVVGAWANNSFFEFGFGKLGWCNCDIFWGQEYDQTTITVKLTGKFGKLASYMAADGDTYVIFCAKGANVVNQLYTSINESTVQSYENSMPIGKQGKMLAFSIKEGVFSYAEQDITISKDMQLTLDLKEITKEGLTAKIKALDNHAK